MSERRMFPEFFILPHASPHGASQKRTLCRTVARPDMLAGVSVETQAVLEMFRQTGGYLQGHFRLTSGLHSPEYLQCAKVLQYPEYAGILGHQLANALQSLGHLQRVDVVCSPAIGGLIIGHEVARDLEARFVFTERGPDNKMVLRRGFAIEPGETAVVVEDVITTGGSTAEVVEVLQAAGAKVLAAGSIIDRSGGKAQVGVSRVALATLNVVTYDPASCPLCAAGSPVVKPGSRPT
jgi:orotate phosphoribosyltransferase